MMSAVVAWLRAIPGEQKNLEAKNGISPYHGIRWKKLKHGKKLNTRFNRKIK